MQPAPAAQPRPKFIDKLRDVAQTTKNKLESLPRTDQSQGRFKGSRTPQPETKTYEVARTPTRSPASTAASRVSPSRTVGPSASDLAKRPSKPTPARSSSGSSTTKSVAKTTSKPASKPKAKPTPKPTPKKSPLIPADHESNFDDLESLADAPPAEAQLLPPAPDDAQAIASEVPTTKSKTPDAPQQAASIPGDSIFRSVIEQATAAAFVHGSTALGMTIVEDSTSVRALTKSEAAPKTQPVDTTDDIDIPAHEALANIARQKASDDRIDAALADAVKIAARVASNDANGTGGLSVDDVLDLTQAEDDLPFIEHKPPSKDSGAGVGDLVISAVNQTDFDIDSSKMEFSGNVQVKSPRFALRSDRFIVHLKPDGSGMAYGEAIGNVYIRMQNNGKPTGHDGFSSKAIYRPDDGKLTLSGWPKIREQHKEHVAATKDTQMVLYTDGRVKTLGRNRTVIRNDS